MASDPGRATELRPLESISDRILGLNKALENVVSRLTDANKRMQGDVPTSPHTPGKNPVPAPAGLISEITQSLIVTEHLVQDVVDQVSRLERI